MQEVKIVAKNYGVLPDGEYNLHNGTIFFLKGPNNVGKSTFLHLLQAIMEVSDDKVNPVKFGDAHEGFVIGSLPGADGKIYQVRYDFNTEGKKTFRFIREDGTKVSTIGEMRAIFNYNHITATDWMTMSQTEAGRKKQRETFISMLSEEERKELNDIDAKINGKTGAWFISRTTTNSEIAVLEGQIKAHIHNEEQRKLLATGNDIKKLRDELLVDRDKYKNIIEDSKVGIVQLESAQKELKTIEDNHTKSSDDLDTEIAELEKKLVEKKAAKILLDKTYNEDITIATKAVEEFSKVVDINIINNARLQLNGEPEKDDMGVMIAYDKPRIKGIVERLVIGEKMVKDYEALVTQKAEWSKTEVELKEKRLKAELLTKDIEEARKRKKTIIKDSKNLPSRWDIEDEYITYDGIPFTESDISMSKAIRAIAELMININDAPIMLMGDAEVLGYPILAELKALAVEHDKIMVFAEHDRDVSDIELVCYEDMDIPDTETETTTKTLF